MINCFTDYITLSKACSPTTPGSALYLDEEFSQIRITSLTAITNTIDRSPKKLMDTLEKRAKRALEDDVRQRMEGRFTRSDVVSGIVSHEYSEPFTLTTAAAEYRGVYLESWGSPYIDIHIEQVQMYLPFGATVPILIYDANSGLLLDTVNLAASGTGYATAQINKTYSVGGKTRRLFICYDATAQTSAVTEQSSNYWDNCECNCAGYDAEFIDVRGASVPTASNVIESNLIKGSDSGGLILTANIECSVGAFICKHKAGFKSAYLRRLLIEFLLEARHTDRVNSWTIYHDREEIDAELYGDGVKVGIFDQYGTMIERVLSQINPEDNFCFECDEEVMMVTTIP